MAYSKQTFTFGQTLSSAEMNQIETNIADHYHGKSNVQKIGISYARQALSGAHTATTDDVGELFECSGTFTISFDPAATLGAGWAVTIFNIGTGIITLDPNAAETINGVSTLTLGENGSVLVYSDGTNLYAIFGGLFTVTNFSASGTWTNPGVRYAVAEVWGPGGNGGNSPNVAAGVGGGGGGGGYSSKFIPGADLSATETVTVGTTGNTSSFGAHCSATSGSNGQGNSSGNNRLGGEGGSGASGDINLKGEPGEIGIDNSGGAGRWSGRGGTGARGAGGGNSIVTEANGSAGSAPGGGGGGALQTDTVGSRTGGTGGDGQVTVWEFY